MKNIQDCYLHLLCLVCSSSLVRYLEKFHIFFQEYLIFSWWYYNYEHGKFDIIKRHYHKVLGFKIYLKFPLFLFCPKGIRFIYNFIIYLMSRDKQVIDYCFPQFMIYAFLKYSKPNLPNIKYTIIIKWWCV